MKNLIYIFLIFLFTNSGMSQDISRDEASRIALHEYIVPPTLDHTVTAYITLNPLQSGDVLSSFLDGQEKTIVRPTWFVWINDNADAFFAHKTRYLLIDIVTGDQEMYYEDWWPELNGEALFMSEEEMTDLNLIIYSDLHLSEINK